MEPADELDMKPGKIIEVIASAAIASAIVPTTVWAQTDPTFVGAKKDEKPIVGSVWKAAAQAGLVHITGNTRQTVVTGGLTASRKRGYNKLLVEASAQYARTGAIIGVADGKPTRELRTTARAWEAKARYDRFLTEHNSVYISALASGDEPAGKSFVGGAQGGYSRQLYTDDAHEVVAEVGYDFSYEEPTVGDGAAIHSGRLFAGYTGKLTSATGVAASLEVLVNVNPLDIGDVEVKGFEDVRGKLKVELTSKLFENLSFSFGVSAKYDNVPATLTFGDPAVAYRAEKLDTTTKASLIFNFL